MELIWCLPDEEGMKELRKKVSAIRAKAVIDYLNSVNATIETKQRVVDEIIRLHNEQEENQ